MIFQMPTTQTIEKGENRMWAVYPFPGNYNDSVRVNQLIDYSKNTPVYGSPRIEISALWIHDEAELRSFRTALDQAELKAIEWANEYTGVKANE